LPLKIFETPKANPGSAGRVTQLDFTKGESMAQENKNATQPGFLSQEQLEAILEFDTCSIANAIDCFGVRLLNEGFTRPGLYCLTGSEQRVIGYAATFRVKSAEPPVIGGRFDDRTDWWEQIQSMPAPRIALFQNMDEGSKGAACVGEVHAAILKAFGCTGMITDGAVRDIAGIKKLGDFTVLAPSVSISHSYMHIVDFGTEVNIFGLSVKPGDLLYADCHGVLAIPIELAAELPGVADRLRQQDRRIIELCKSADFSPEKLLQLIRENVQ
jgi:regulator of RNase E activity RraA